MWHMGGKAKKKQNTSLVRARRKGRQYTWEVNYGEKIENGVNDRIEITK